MSINIVLPSLTNWAKQHLSALYTITDRTDFNSAFDAFISKDVTITVNGQKISRDEYQQQLLSQKFAEAGAQVKFLGAVEVPQDSKQPILAGNVGVFFQAIVDETLRVLGGPESSTVTSSLNIVVVQDKTLQRPHMPGKGGIFDPRRVSILNQVTVDKQNAILIPLPNPNPTSGSTASS